MRPCTNCGSPIANNQTTCLECLGIPKKTVQPSLNNTPDTQTDDPEDRTQIHKFLWWAFALLILFLPALSFVLSGTVIALLLLVIGVFIFVMLEQLTH